MLTKDILGSSKRLRVIAHAQVSALLPDDQDAQKKARDSQEAFVLNPIPAKYVILLPRGYGHYLC